MNTADEVNPLIPKAKTLNLARLRLALADYLPRTPGYRTILAAIEAGMPYIPDPLGRERFRTFELDKVLNWWFTNRAPKPLLNSATDAAIRVSRARRKPKSA
jgi:hypothetical protein